MVAVASPLSACPPSHHALEVMKLLHVLNTASTATLGVVDLALLVRQLLGREAR